MMNREKLQDAVNSKFVPVYMTTKSEVWEYLVDKHRGDTKAAASEGARMLSGESSGKAYKNARRNFEARGGALLGKKEGKTPKWASVGKQLPPIGKRLPGNELTLTVKGTQHEKGGDRYRDWTVTFKGADAYDFANDPNYWAFFEALNYDFDVIAQFDGDDSSSVVVTSVA